MNRRSFLHATAALPLAAIVPQAQAQAQGAWPNRPVTLVVPFGPGSGSDLVAQAIAPRLQSALGKPVTVEHRPGRSGTEGAITVARAAPDGHTLIVAQSGVWTTNHLLGTPVGYDPVADFTPITVAGATPHVLVVNPRATDATDLIALTLWLKRPDARATYASAGAGLADHLTMELFRQAMNAALNHAPQPGAAQVIAAVAEGRSAQLAFVPLGNAVAPVRERRLRPIMITSARRSALLPNVPTAAESGLHDFVVEAWQGIMGPARMPAPVQQRVHAAMTAALRAPETVRAFDQQGFGVIAGTPQQFAALQQREIRRWRAVVQAANITVTPA